MQGSVTMHISQLHHQRHDNDMKHWLICTTACHRTWRRHHWHSDSSLAANLNAFTWLLCSSTAVKIFYYKTTWNKNLVTELNSMCQYTAMSICTNNSYTGYLLYGIVIRQCDNMNHSIKKQDQRAAVQLCQLPGKPGLAGRPLNSQSPFIHNYTSYTQTG